MKEQGQSEAETIVREGVSLLRPSGQAFAHSLLNQLSERGSLSARQFDCLGTLAAEIEEARKRQAAKPVEISLVKINEMFAAHGGKRAFFMIKASDGQRFRVARATSNSRYYGQLMVTSEGATFGERKWYGRIDDAGKFQRSYVGGIQSYDGVIAALVEFAADPVAVAVAYGIETKECCFCAIELTDPRSVEVGYGPVCAKKWSLPHSANRKLVCVS